MTLDPRELGRSLLVVASLSLACTPTPTEVAGDGGPTTGPDDPTVGPVTADGPLDADGPEDTGPVFESVCGDGIVELPEQCDLGGLNGTGMYCTEDCQANECGDGYKGPGEACDDGNQSNEDLCTTSCGPTTCGDGFIQGDEDCDDGEDNSPSGACLPSCVEARCGDQAIQSGVEVCDSDAIDGQSCESLGFSGGVLLCAPDCLDFDTAGCFHCGDGSIDPDEVCDGAALPAGATCENQGFDDGTLACSATCTLDTSGCVSFACGNGVIDGSDQCDGAQLGGATCTGQGFAGGTLACSPGCTFDTGDCYACGDGSIDPGEACDGAQLGGATCQALAMPGQTVSGGMPACSDTCMLIEGSCTFCGDDDQAGTEQCDGTDLAGLECSSPSVLGPDYAGELGCAMDCTLDTSGCCLDGGATCENHEDCCSGTCNGSNVCTMPE